ncbi:MAG: D-alanyl-D-alanine carboxypeptidase, partial [Xanthobacteraceae bacterium]
MAAILLLAAVGTGLLIAPARAAPAAPAKPEGGFATSVPAAILLDAESDSILYDKNGDQPVEPASLAKLMTLEYLFNE